MLPPGRAPRSHGGARSTSQPAALRARAPPSRRFAPADASDRGAQYDASEGNSVSPLLQTLSGHVGRVYGVHFHPQELALVSCSQDGASRATPAPQTGVLASRPWAPQLTVPAPRAAATGTARLWTL